MNARPASLELARSSTFWMGTAALAGITVCTYRESNLSDFVGFLLIVLAALLPAALWCWNRQPSLPIFPIFTLGTIGTFALPLINHHPLVMEYTQRQRFLAALTVAGTNLAGTLSWHFIARKKALSQTTRFLILRARMGSGGFAAVLIGTIFFNLAQGALMSDLDPSLFSIVRATVIALSNLAVFVLAYLWGRHGLTRASRFFQASLISATMVSTLPSALMVGALAYGLLALMGYALGAGRVPWIPLAALGGTALFLQGGKEELRNKYWYSADAAPITLTDFPGMLSDWVRFSAAKLADASEPSPAVIPTASQSFVERASLLQLFLRIQEMSPAQVPYLHGRTYAIIPDLLVPRVLNEEKARSHLGTYMLAIHYDLQTTEDTFTTTIGFGLINEAMANFGYVGCLALGTGLGLFYGWVARWSAGYPLLSLRSLLAILILSVAFENEFSAGVFVTTLFQGACVLLVLAPLIMVRTGSRPRRISQSLTSVPA